MDSAADWSRPESDGQGYRFEKKIAAHAPETHPDYPAVIAVQGADPRDEGRRLGELLRFLKSNGVISSYGQAALLLHSVKDSASGPYLDSLEAAGIWARCEPAGHSRHGDGDEALVTTIHQAKGQEWDVVVIGSLNSPSRENDPIGEVLAQFRAGPSAEPAELIPGFDSARRHYVGFTRARRLLVLTCSGQPQPRFRTIWNSAARWPHVDRAALARQRFDGERGEPMHLDMEFETVRRLTQSGWVYGRSTLLPADGIRNAAPDSVPGRKRMATT